MDKIRQNLLEWNGLCLSHEMPQAKYHEVADLQVDPSLNVNISSPAKCEPWKFFGEASPRAERNGRSDGYASILRPPLPPPQAKPQEVGQDTHITVSGCAHPVVGSIVNGSFIRSGENHGKPVYKKTEQTKDGVDVLIYFWNDTANPTFCRLATAPLSGWKVPYDGPVDPQFQIEVDRTAVDCCCAGQWKASAAEKRLKAEAQRWGGASDLMVLFGFVTSTGCHNSALTCRAHAPDIFLGFFFSSFFKSFLLASESTRPQTMQRGRDEGPSQKRKPRRPKQSNKKRPWLRETLRPSLKLLDLQMDCLALQGSWINHPLTTARFRMSTSLPCEARSFVWPAVLYTNQSIGCLSQVERAMGQIRQVLGKLKRATGKNLEELEEELKTVMAKELEACGPHKAKLKEEPCSVRLWLGGSGCRDGEKTVEQACS
eukprot:Skav223327  [mRNA]  locus=scaffold200:121597:124778:+ [translate_table: standard]